MNLTLERPELAILILHMNIMRKSIRKGFKSNYGQFEGRRKLKEYDQVKDRFMDQLNEETDPICFVLEDSEINMLHSFLNWYVLEIKLSAEIQNADITKDEQIEILESIKNKVNVIVDSVIQKGII